MRDDFSGRRSRAARCRVAVGRAEWRAGHELREPPIWTGSWQPTDRPGWARAMVSKCAWCEQRRPWKRELDVATLPGPRSGSLGRRSSLRERHAVTRGRRRARLWWLAFGWSDYSLCKTCNQHWKRNLFPVVRTRPACAEGVELVEKPLLLDPGVGVPHARPLPLDRRRDSRARLHPRGTRQIVTCGLNRKDLHVRRLKVAIGSGGLNGLALRQGRGTASATPSLPSPGSGQRSEEFTSMVRWFRRRTPAVRFEEAEGVPA